MARRIKEIQLGQPVRSLTIEVEISHATKISFRQERPLYKSTPALGQEILCTIALVNVWATSQLHPTVLWSIRWWHSRSSCVLLPQVSIGVTMTASATISASS